MVKHDKIRFLKFEVLMICMIFLISIGRDLADRITKQRGKQFPEE